MPSASSCARETTPRCSPARRAIIGSGLATTTCQSTPPRPRSSNRRRQAPTNQQRREAGGRLSSCPYTHQARNPPRRPQSTSPFSPPYLPAVFLVPETPGDICSPTNGDRRARRHGGCDRDRGREPGDRGDARARPRAGRRRRRRARRRRRGRRSPAGRRPASTSAGRGPDGRARLDGRQRRARRRDDLRRDRPARRRDASSPSSPTGSRRSSSGRSTAPVYLADEDDRVGLAVRPRRPQAQGPLRAGRRRRRDRPVELPAQQLLRRLHPGARRRQRGRPQALRDHPAHLAADGRDAGRGRRCPRASSRSRPAAARPAPRWSTSSTT